MLYLHNFWVVVLSDLELGDTKKQNIQAKSHY